MISFVQIQMISIIVFVIFIMGCTDDETITQDHFGASIIYGGQGLYEFNLAEAISVKIAEFNKVSISNVESMHNNSYLISYFVLTPSKERHKIAIYNEDTNEFSEILVGSHASFLGAHNKILFYNNDAHLALTDLDDIENIKVVNKNHPGILVNPVQVSDDEFIYESDEDGVYKIWKYNIDSEVSESLNGIKNCSLSRAVWRSRTQEILCAEVANDGSYTGRYILSSLEGKVNSSVPLVDGEVWPVIYWPKLDAVFFQKRYVSNFQEKHALYLFSFDNQTNKLISEDILLSRDVGLINKIN